MDRRRFLLTSLAGALGAPLAVEAQQAGRVWRIGFLGSGAPTGWGGPGIEAIRLGLKDHGYVEGQNIKIEYRWAEDRYDRIPELAAELVRLNPDVIITYGTPSTLALKRATSAIPIVMAIIGNPVENGAVSSLARPGGNITGSSFFSDEITAKRLEILKAAHPALVRAGFLGSSRNLAMLGGQRAAASMAQSLNVQLQVLDVRSSGELGAALTGVVKAHSDGVVMSDEQVIATGDAPRQIAEFLLKNRLPSIGPAHYPRVGGLLGYGVVWPDVVRGSMAFVDKILKGSKPADLPIQQATKFELVINLKTAKALGLTIPPSLLARADQVIE
jgi:putative tryptophan/tyrosine transport system substrate-binding protein